MENTTNLNKSDDLPSADFMMKNIVQFGKFSYELEEKREQSLLAQSNNMLTAFSIFSAVLLLAIPIIIDNTTINIKQLLLCSSVIFFFLIISLILTIFSQWRYKYKTMATVGAFYAAVNSEYENYKNQAQFDSQWKEQLLQIQQSKKQNNDRRSKLIMASMVSFLFAIFSVFVSAFLLLFFNI